MGFCPCKLLVFLNSQFFQFSLYVSLFPTAVGVVWLDARGASPRHHEHQAAGAPPPPHPRPPRPRAGGGWHQPHLDRGEHHRVR